MYSGVNFIITWDVCPDDHLLEQVFTRAQFCNAYRCARIIGSGTFTRREILQLVKINLVGIQVEQKFPGLFAGENTINQFKLKRFEHMLLLVSDGLDAVIRFPGIGTDVFFKRSIGRYDGN